MTPLSGRTALTLSPYAARGLTQTLDPIFGSNAAGTLIRRSVNGKMIDFTVPWFRQYQSTVTCTDVETPCLDGAWLGEIVQVDCVHELNFPTGATPQRHIVHGSEHVVGHFTYYRPQLIMMVTNIRNSKADYQGAYSWQIDLQENELPV